MQNPKVSIIIPIFNAEKYLRRCIDSVLSQSFSDYELLLVDDGSSDSSGVISDEYAARDSRIRVFHKPNGGVSSARNLGLDNASGEWIYFVDADDELFPDALNHMMDVVNDTTDIALFGFEKINEQGKCIFSRSGDNMVKNLSVDECLFAPFQNVFYGYSYLGWMWIWLFKHTLLEKENIRFNTNISFKEDTLFIIQFLCRCASNCIFSSRPIYKYRESETSIFLQSKKQFNPKYLTSFDACELIDCELQKVYPSKSDIHRQLSLRSIWDRYYIIRSRMKVFSHRDDNMLRSYRHRAIRATGVVFSLKYQIQRNWRRLKNHIK